MQHAQRMTDACFRLDKKVAVGLKAQHTTVLYLKQFSTFNFPLKKQSVRCLESMKYYI